MDDQVSALMVHRSACLVECIVTRIEDTDRLPRAVRDDGPLAIVEDDVLVWSAVARLRILIV
jgi:hypothetical protein